MRSDLTPSNFVLQMKARKTLRLWLIPVAICAAITFFSIVIQRLNPEDDYGRLAEERAELAEASLHQAKSQIASQTKLLAVKKRELQAAEHLTLRPDWSAVLTLLAKQFDDDLMMTGCRLGRGDESLIRQTLAPIGDEVSPGSVWLVVSGVAQSNSVVPGLVMRLESLGLFERIVLTGSKREAFAGGSRTLFVIACQVQ